MGHAGQKRVSDNIYRDHDGNVIKGKYLHLLSNGRYRAMFYYPEGHQKCKLFYELEEAKTWLDTQWDFYKTGTFYDVCLGREVTIQKVSHVRYRLPPVNV